MEGLVHGKCSKIKSRRGNRKTIDVKVISIWKLQFENQGLRLSKDWNSSFVGFTSSHFRNCARKWVVAKCTSSHTL
jgi:hypothetical protein